MVIKTTAGEHKSPSADKFTILDYIFNHEGKMQESLDERMQTANQAWWSDVKIHKSKDVARVKYIRVVDQVDGVFCSVNAKLVPGFRHLRTG